MTENPVITQNADQFAELTASLTEQQLEDLLNQKRSKRNSERETYKTLVAEAIPQAIDELIHAAQVLAYAKQQVFSAFENIVALKKDVYQVSDKQKSHSFSDEKNGGLTIGYRETEGWDDTVTAGIEKITKFIESLATDANSAALVKTVFNLLRKDASGNLRSRAVFELEKLQTTFNNVDFNDGVKIIRDAYKPVPSCWFIDAWRLNELGEKVSIPLSISAVDFPSGYEFKGF